MANKALAVMCLTLMIGVSLFASSVTARTETASAVLSVPKDKVKPGDTVEVSVSVKQATDLYGVQFALSYDADRLKLVSSKVSDQYSHFANECESCKKGENTIYLLIRKNMKDTGYKGNIKLATFVFKAEKEGVARVELRKLKGISTEIYVNELGYNDMKSVTIHDAAPVNIEVKKAGNGNGNGNGNGKQ